MFRFLSRGRVGKRPRAGIGKFTRDGLHPESLEPRTMLNASAAGDEFIVNNFTDGSQSNPAVASNSQGATVVVWQNFPPNDAAEGDPVQGIYGQLYDFAGNAVGSNFRISEVSDLSVFNSAVEMDEAGNFVVAWNRGTITQNNFAPDGDIIFRRFNSAGNPLTDEIVAHEGSSEGRQFNVANYLAMDSDGDFIVTWADFKDTGTELLAQRFDETGQSVGQRIQVNPQKEQYSPLQIAMDESGFAVTWVEQNSDIDNPERDILAQFFNANGTALTDPTDISSEGHPAVSFDFDIARDAQGNTMVVWVAPSSDPAVFRIEGRQFDFGGTPLAEEFIVSSVVNPGAGNPAVDYDTRIAMNDIGEFVVTWQQSGGRVVGRAFDPGAIGEGVLLAFNLTSAAAQPEHGVAMNGLGDYFVAWGAGTATTQDVFARRILDDTTSTIGGFDRDTGMWYLRNQTFAGAPDFQAFPYGGAGWQPVVGDWNGDGQDTIGVVSPLGEWYLRNTNSSGDVDIPKFGYGRYDWIPVAGDWDGDGADSIGSYNRAIGGWYLRNTNSSGNADVVIRYGGPNFVPVVGDWDDDGDDTIGVYDIKTGTWYLNNSNSAGTPSITPFQFGGPGFTPVVGDWDNNGTDTVGVVSPDGTWYIRNSNTSGLPDISPFPYGHSKFAPVAGDWDARANLLLAAGTSDLAATAPPITNEQLQPIVNEAIVRWASIDVDAAPLLAGVDVRLADLNPGELGRTLGHTIWIDRDAAGQGWFVDLTPADDEEFTSTLAQGLLRAENGPAGGRYDLLSVVAHELGHVLGLEHGHSEGEHVHVMGPSLSTGLRTMPVADAVDRILREG